MIMKVIGVSLSIATLAFASTMATAKCASLFTPKSDRGMFPDPQFGGGPPGGLASVPQSLISIQAGTDNNNATASFAFLASEAGDLIKQANPTTPIYGCSQALAFTLSSPIDKSDNVTDLATLDGLANAFTLKASYTRYNDSIWLRDLSSLRARLVKKSGDENISLDLVNLEKHFGKNSSIVEEYNAAGRIRSWFWGGEARVGRESFSYIDFDSFAKESANENPWSLAVFVGGDVGNWVFTGRLKVETSFKSTDNVSRCRPIEGSNDLDCLTGSPGLPDKKEAVKGSIEARRILWGRIGISPSINYDFEDEVFGVDAPIFLWQDKQGQLTGGVRIGWRDDTKNTEFALFITQPF